MWGAQSEGRLKEWTYFYADYFTAVISFLKFFFLNIEINFLLGILLIFPFKNVIEKKESWSD